MARQLVFLGLTLSYPLAIWLLAGKVEPRWLALSLVLLGSLRLAATKQRWWVVLSLVAFALAAVTGVLNEAWPLKWYPVLVNGSLLMLFGVTLWRPPSMVERLAKFSEPTLPVQAIEYTRKVTIAWCVFFLCNGSVAVWTTVFGSDAQWALYNGIIAYGFMGAFAGIEYTIRRHVRRRTTQPTEGF